MTIETTELTVQRFNNIQWHDSKLVGLCLHRAEGEDQVKILLDLLERGGNLTPAEIIFKESVYIDVDVYLEAKAMCSDDISDAECRGSSDWKRNVSRPGPHDIIQGNRRFEEYLHFAITLCPPSGTINILAKSFSLKMKAPR